MDSTLKSRDSDPHDDFAIAPDLVTAAWADKVLADITRDSKRPLEGPLEGPSDDKIPALNRQPPSASDRPPSTAQGVAAAAPTVDTTFRATAIDDIQAPVQRSSSGRWAKSAVIAFMFALCSALAAAAWEHYGDVASQMITNWTPPFALSASSSPEAAALAEQADTPKVAASSEDQTPPHMAPPAEFQESAAPAPTAPIPGTAQRESVTGDLAAMAQQIEQLKASIAELRAGQQAMARDVAKASEVKASEVKASEVKTSEPRPSEPRPSAPKPRPRTAAPPYRPMPAYPPAQAAVPAALPQAASPPVSALPAPPQATRTEDGEPIVRPPMPLR